MINGKTVLAIIPARGGSKGLPRKNVMPLHGCPLVCWPIQAALKSKYIDKIMVSTDDPEIADIALADGAEVPFLRPEELATDSATTHSVLEHAIHFLSDNGEFFDYCVLLEPTSPLTESQDIDDALELLNSQRDIADSIVGVSKVEATHPVFDVKINTSGLIEPFMWKDFSAARRRQYLSTLYFFDGTLYISDISVLLHEKSFYHKRTLPFITPKWKSFEVDDIVDFTCIDAIIIHIDKIRESKLKSGS
jgi:N-acylneuraminate cytidylyltransferase/CMP-N,N'-diacetyllegionaminic acid synthase